MVPFQAHTLAIISARLAAWLGTPRRSASLSFPQALRDAPEDACLLLVEAVLARRQPQVAPALQGAALVRLAVVAAQLVAVLVRPQVAPAPLELAPARQEAPGPGSAASAPEQPASAPEQPAPALVLVRTHDVHDALDTQILLAAAAAVREGYPQAEWGRGVAGLASSLAAADTQEVLVGARHRAWAAR